MSTADIRSTWARFWSVDLHVHTPASSDARADDFGSPDDIVSRAIDAGLDAIAITDHNTAAWCGPIAEAAKSTPLVVLPGVELSTNEGHLLGIWEAGTATSVIEDVIIGLGIERSRLGSLDVVTRSGMVDCADAITGSGGVAIAAHIDKERGILANPVQTHVNQLLADPRLAAFEYVMSETPAKVAAKLGGARGPALVQASDAYDATASRHTSLAIGIRRTWIKAAAPDLRGLRYALEDPELRVRLTDPSAIAPHPTIDAVAISGGFLGGTTLEFGPDLNCLLGGTGAGKSLLLEAVRFALDQQADRAAFSVIRGEVDRRLESALGIGTEVAVYFSTSSGSYRVTRTYGSAGAVPVVEQEASGDWVRVDRTPAALLGIAAYSQGEILEHARQPVGRVGLVDAHINMSAIDTRIASAEARLRVNGKSLIAARDLVLTLTADAAEAPRLRDRERELSTLFDDDVVKAQALWAGEQAALTGLTEALDRVTFTAPKVPAAPDPKVRPEHDEQFRSVQRARDEFAATVELAERQIVDGLDRYRTVVRAAKEGIGAEFDAFKAKLDEVLEKSGSTSLRRLRRELEDVQSRLSRADEMAVRLRDEASPELERLQRQREDLLAELKRARDDRRTMRREIVAALNKKTTGSVRIDIPPKGDVTRYREALEKLKVGSHMRDQVVRLIADHVRPFNLVRAIWSGDATAAGKLPDGVTLVDIARLQTNVADNGLWSDLLDIQLIDTPDVLNVKFRKPGERGYTDIEELSHGQKCTAVLVILLAAGDDPVLIDQPEDALHAPWIEEYLVDRLRQFRGSRQYIFATRSPGLVVSADAEQLITMRATSGRGEVEASGSLERFDLNRLALQHLEGGRTPFHRRTRKLRSSLSE
jgi:hypothetical protein